MIIEIANDYALPGFAAEVLEQRKKASQLWVALGLPPGRISTKREGVGPDVRWECLVETEEAYPSGRKARAKSPVIKTRLIPMAPAVTSG